MIEIDKQSITGVILAGGQARRMHGQDKGLLQLNNSSLISLIIKKLEQQVATIIINANRNLEEYSRFDYPVISDTLSGYCGPLAGIASALQHCQTDYLVTVPCDSPFIPEDLVMRLAANMQKQKSEISVATTGERMQPVFSMMKTKLLPSLQAYLDSGERKIDRWFNQHVLAETDFSDRPEAFININTPDELQQAEMQLKSAAR